VVNATAFRVIPPGGSASIPVGELLLLPFTVEAQQRESYLAGCVRIVEQARRAVGCLDVAICADLVDPGRVNIFERRESQAALETFLSSGPGTEQRRAMLKVSVQEYDIADVRERAE
jgi:quinol monooxygenase YgiN